MFEQVLDTIASLPSATVRAVKPNLVEVLVYRGAAAIPWNARSVRSGVVLPAIPAYPPRTDVHPHAAKTERSLPWPSANLPRTARTVASCHGCEFRIVCNRLAGQVVQKPPAARKFLRHVVFEVLVAAFGLLTAGKKP
jgi:hypothetical protein